MTSAPAVPVTLAEIARLAGVGRAAVSNWRRRHESFPARIGGTEGSPQFSLTEIESWLRDNNKLKSASGREWLWPRFEALGSRDETGRAIAAAGRVLAGGSVDPEGAAGQQLSQQAFDLVDSAAELGQREGPLEIFEFLLRRCLDVNVRQISTTPEPLASLMVDLGLRVRDRLGAGANTGLTVLDPACGTGHLLGAAAVVPHVGTLRGCDTDPVLAELADARLRLVRLSSAGGPVSSVSTGDSLRADPLADARADVVVCNPPFNERDWGYEELATDARWAHGMPPRTEPELAWVQHCLARLRPGGTAVVLLPPAVANRRAGRRIRGSLLRTGMLRAVIALPPGYAPPHSVSLQLWVLQAPGEGVAGSDTLLLADGVSRFPRISPRDFVPDWEALGAFVRSAVEQLGAGPEVEGTARECMAAVPVIDLLDDEVDLTPGRHIASVTSSTGSRLADSWKEFSQVLEGLGESAGRLAGLELAEDDGAGLTTTTVGELARAGALTVSGGQQPDSETTLQSRPDEGSVPLLTVPDLLLDGTPRSWLPLTAVEASGATVAAPGDVIVAGVARAFSAWVHEGAPTALGPQLYALRVHPDQLDAWFLAGSLRAPANARQAGTHASSSSRVDVRRLQVRQVPLAEQKAYRALFQQVAALDKQLKRMSALGTGLVRDLSDELAAGRITGPA
ncbi:N-6 DNA methylase [Streptomyces sp. NPDC127112]|uniref:N-6 DNA methylase n=1 Tax=Streptomyces sp. NPDC127112 TaxID=3345364 RepID=UPI003640AFA8